VAVKCPKCQLDNPADTDFCGHCGVRLPKSREPAISEAITKDDGATRFLKGTTFAGRYEIIEKLGEGGMGEVYKARDMRLERTVAIKVMPPSLAGDPDLRSRFEREARSISALNHPHICTLYEFASFEGNDFIVLEYIEGETLASRLEKGALKPDDALQIGLQIAEALDAAHQRGIIHRDLKPGNIMLTKTGAKLLDFGLAKLRAEFSASKGEQLPSRTITATAKGAIIGTLQYMAPEQLEGKDIDSRVDIFAFGAILYEMLTGRRAFEGKSSASVIAAILEREPTPVSSLIPMVPPYVDRIINTCLAKEPEKRWQTASELQHVLRWTGQEAQTAAGTDMTRIKRPRLIWLYRAAACAALLGLGFLAGSRIFHRPAETKRPQIAQQLSILLQDKEPLAPVGEAPLGIGRPALALAPDGSKLVYVGEHGDETALYLRPLDSQNSRALPGTDGAFNPFFSPDGLWVGFFSGNQLKKTSVASGQPVTLCEAINAHGATWADDGNIYFASKEGLSLSRISSEGGLPEIVAAADAGKGIARIRLPQCLPGGRGILFSDGMLSLATHELKFLNGVVNPRYLSTGHLLYSAPGVLMAAPFDLERLEITGAPLPVLDGIRTETYGAAQYAVSRDGLLVFLPGQSAAFSRPAWVDRDGRLETLPFRPERYGSSRISPDGTKLAISILGATDHVWIFDLVGKGEPQRFSTEENEHHPVWTPDGTRLAFSGLENGNQNVFWRPADRSQERERLAQKKDSMLSPDSWSPDGQRLAITEQTPGGWDVSILNLKTRELQPFLATRFNEWGAAFSPDGRWIAYTSDESGQYEVYVQTWPPTGRKWQVSKTAGGNEEPVWSNDGRELFYRNGRRWMSVPISTSPAFSAGAPRLLFQGDYLNVSGLEYGVSPDGKRFLVLQSADTSRPTELRVVVNWFEELKRLVPVGKK
jgi:serine/threonine protein kinase/Tol biopolymer transport system component